jgi:hypothetical protein
MAQFFFEAAVHMGRILKANWAWSAAVRGKVSIKT